MFKERMTCYTESIKKLEVNETNMSPEQRVKYAAALNKLRESTRLIAKEICIQVLTSIFYNLGNEFESISKGYIKKNEKGIAEIVEKALNNYYDINQLFEAVLTSKLYEFMDTSMAEPYFQKFNTVTNEGLVCNSLIKGVWNAETNCWITEKNTFCLAYPYRKAM